MKNDKISIFFFVLFSFFSCQRDTITHLDLQLLSQNIKSSSAQFDDRNAQELNAKKVKNITSKGINYVLKDNELLLQLEENDASFTFNSDLLNIPHSLRDYHEIKFEFENRSDIDIKTNIILWGPRGRLPDTLMIVEGKQLSKTIDLHDLPLIGSPSEKYLVSRIQFQFNNRQNAEVALKSIDLIQKSSNKDLVVVDRFGQRKSMDWPGKVADESEFKEHLDRERNSLVDLFDETSFDQYLGLKTGTSYESNGYFSIASEMINGEERWFFTTPDGNPFWSYGTTGIRPKKPMHAVTLIKGNEQLFEQLPDRNGPYASAYIDSTLSYYYVNLLRKYGSIQGWREMSFKRLKSWGLNTIGNWAEDSLLMESEVPFTYALETSIKAWDKDVFDPSWEHHVDSVFSRAATFKNNRYLLGYFVDNEAGWGNLKLLQSLPKEARLREVWVNALKKKYGSLKSLNATAKEEFENWRDVATCGDPGRFAKEDILILDKLYTEKYFGTIVRTLKKHDPNHLYLGCRFTRKLKPAHILEIAGKYCDVITVNVYSYEPIKKDMDKWYELTGKPILIGEHQAALNSSRQLPLRWQTFDHEERYEYFTNYVSKWAHMPYSLGSHWYQYSDQHITGRASNGENQIIGFVDITDQPYQRMIDAARHNFNHIYQWKGLKAESAL